MLNGLYFKRGKQLYLTNNLKEALASLLQAKNYGNLEADSLIEEIRFQLAKKHIKNGKLKAALSEIKACLTIDPSNSEYLETKNSIEQNLQQAKKAKIRKAMPFVIVIVIIFIAFLVYKKFLIGQVSIHITPEDYEIKSNQPSVSVAAIKLIIDGK